MYICNVSGKNVINLTSKLHYDVQLKKEYLIFFTSSLSFLTRFIYISYEFALSKSLINNINEMSYEIDYILIATPKIFDSVPDKRIILVFKIINTE